MRDLDWGPSPPPDDRKERHRIARALVILAVIGLIVQIGARLSGCISH
jgi:hypothetical protein